GRLQRHADAHALAGADAAKHAAGMVGEITLRRHFIAMLFAALFDHGKTIAYFHGLHRVDAHHRLGEVGINAIEHRLAPARRYAVGKHGNARTNRGAVLADGVDVLLQRLDLAGVREEERVVVDDRPVIIFCANGADLLDATENTNAKTFLQELARDGTCRHTHGGFARGRATTATVIAEAVFLYIGVVGVTGAEGARDLGVVLAALVGVFDQQADRGAGGLALEHAGQDLHCIRFATLGGIAAGAGLAAIQFALQ